MDLNSIVSALTRFISQHYSQFQNLSRCESQLLEVGALMLATEHYRRQGFQVQVVNPVKHTFKLKLGAKGKAFNFSWYEARKGDVRIEIHGNLAVSSAYGHDEGIYVVDVGVVEAGKLPAEKAARKDWKCIENKWLITFIESKKLVIYPMLMAQFLGIVHEIKPHYLLATCAVEPCHFFPALVSIGYLKGISRGIQNGFKARHFKLNVVPTFDVHISQMAHDQTMTSPFEPIAHSDQLHIPPLPPVTS